MILVVFISINVVSADGNVTDAGNVILNTSDVDLIGENLVYSASLQSDNAPVSNQTILFSVNGMNYTRLTDDEGFAFLDINLNDGIYPISTAFNDANNHQLINSNIIYVSHAEGTLIKDNLSGEQIQNIIDDANSGDTLIFAGSTYTDVAINVVKPLNIVSIASSALKGDSLNPVIRISSDDVNVSNFIISSGSIGIVLDAVNNVGIFNNNIINNNEGIDVLNSNNTSISNNNITNSRNNAIYLKNAVNTNISYNRILTNNNGIYFDSDVVDTQIYSNYLSKSDNNAISLAKSGSFTNISYNTIERNEHGIFADMVGDENLNIEFNTIQRNGGNGIYFGNNYRKTNETGILNVANNSIVYNTEFNILARESVYNDIKLNENWIASDDPRFDKVCNKVKFAKTHMDVNQIDGNTLSVSVDGIKTDSVLRISFNGGKNWKNINLVDGKATIDVSNDDGNVMFDYFENTNSYQYQMENYVPPTPVTPVVPDTPVVPETPETPEDSTPDSSQTDANATNSQSEKIDGNGTASNPNSGSSQGQSQTNVDNSNNAIEEVSSQSAESSSAQPASQTVSSASDSQSVSKEISNPTDSIAKALNIDEEVVRIAGMGFILLLIIAVIGLYYRDDVKFMLNKRNGQ